MDFVCQKCLNSFKDKDIFSNHIKKDHSLTLKNYFENFEIKTDTVSGNKIIFKSIEQYLLTDFETKTNMLKWMKSVSPEISKKFIFDKIKNFSDLKSVSIFPSSSEFRTLSYLPSLKTINFFFEDLNNFIDSTGLSRRYNYNLNELKLNFILQKNIAVDTREQKPIVFKGLQCEKRKVEYGDYSCDDILSVERKSLNDLVSTLSKGFERFQREIERAKENNGYIVVVVDCDINKFLSFEFSGSLRYGKASSEFIFHRFREINRLFPETIQFCFSGGRKESANLIPIILANNIEIISKLDIQYLIEKKIINL